VEPFLPAGRTPGHGYEEECFESDEKCDVWKVLKD
jgi:hypothetical protein